MFNDNIYKQILPLLSSMSYYTLQEVKTILYDGLNNKIDKDTKDKIDKLSALIVVSDDKSQNYKKKSHNEGDSYKRGYRNKDNLEIEDWERIRNFKTTIIEKKKGIEKKVNEIRIALNKFSKSNKALQTERIKKLISEVLEEDTDETDTNMEKISRFVFDTASSNAFYSEIYAEFYKNIMNEYVIFRSKISNIIENYKKSFDNIVPVDPNKDYDGYCDYVKLNDKRKSMSTFMCNLAKYDVLDSTELYKIIKYITNLIPEMSCDEDKSSIIEEYCDNLYIIITTVYALYKQDDKFTKKIIPRLKEISMFRKTDQLKYKSMSSRASFKIMDILDFTKKN